MTAVAPIMQFRAELNSRLPVIKALVPKGFDHNRLVTIIFNEVKNNKKLLDCTPDSLIGAVVKSVQLGLEVGQAGLGECYIIPYGKKATFVLGYVGLKELLFRSGYVKDIKMGEIKENDQFDYQEGTDEFLFFKKEIIKPRGDTIAYFAQVSLVSGAKPFIISSKHEMEDHRKKFCSINPTWNSHFDAMSKKTVLKMLSKNLPISSSDKKKIMGDGKIINITGTENPEQTEEFPSENSMGDVQGENPLEPEVGFDFPEEKKKFLTQNEEKVNDFLRHLDKIKDNQTWRDLSDNQKKQINSDPDYFNPVLGGG